MADDPERDLIPVKEGAACAGQRNGSVLLLSSEKDKLQAPYLAKLDRKELEDRFMCVMLDNSNLKKECNKQEEKIKRLATKLLRLVAEQKRDLPTAAQRHDHNLECLVVEQQQQIRELQQSNNQLQDRVMVLRNQLVEHTSVHSAVHCNLLGKSRFPSRSHARSHTRTCVSSSTRQNVLSSHTSQNVFQPNLQTNTPHCGTQDTIHPIDVDSIEGHQRLYSEQKIPDVPNSKAAVAQQNQKLSEDIMRLHEQISVLEQNLETQCERSSARIAELEDELASTVADNQQQKVAENIEMIRLQRSLQQQSAHMAAQSAQNQVLEQDLAHLRQELETVQQDNDELHHQLTNERQKVADLQQQLQGMGSSCLSVRELQEQIRDVQSERSTLKEHNERLLALISARQIQSSEQEVTLHLQVSQLESTLAKERSERAELMQRIKQLEAQDEAHLQHSAGQEKDHHVQVMQLEAALASEMKERRSLLETLNGMHQNKSEPNTCLISDQESALHVQVTQLETKLAKELTDRAQILNSLEEERTQVAALKVAHSDLLVKLQDLQAQHTKIEGQLQAFNQDPRRGVSFHIPPPAPSVLPSCSSPRIPTLQQSRLAQRLTSNSGKSCQMSSSSSLTEDHYICPDKMNYGRLKDLDILNASESILDVSCDSQTSQTSYSEIKSSASLFTNKGFEMSTKASNQEKSLHRKTNSCCKCGIVPSLLKEGCCACLKLSSPSLNLSHGHEDSVHVTDEEASSDPHIIDVTLKANTERISFSLQSGHFSLPHDSHLQDNKGEKSKSVSEEGSPVNDDSVTLKIPDHDSLQNNDVNILNADCGGDWITTANQLDISRELGKCRELLRVQYNLNSMYKKEVTSLAKQLKQSEDDHAKKMDEMTSLLQKQTTCVSKLQDQLGPSVLDHKVHDTGHLTIGVGDGLFEIHVHCLHLSPEGSGSLMKEPCDPVCKESELRSLFLTWMFYGQDVAYTPMKAAKTNIEFNSSYVYRVTVNNEFLQYLEEADCIIEVHMTVDDASELVARGPLHFSEVFRFQQNKIHSTVPLVGTGTQETVVEFGVIECWFQLTCSIGLISSYLQHRAANKVTTKMPVPAPRQRKKQISPGISNIISSNTTDSIITEVQIQPGEEDATKDGT